MIKREALIFLVVGSLTVLVDYFAYLGLTSLDLNVELSKGVSFLVGTVFAYFSNKLWTFGHKDHAPGSVWRFIALYTSTLMANVVVNMICLSLFGSFQLALQFAFVTATGVSALLNFVGMKFFVFNERFCQELR